MNEFLTSITKTFSDILMPLEESLSSKQGMESLFLRYGWYIDLTDGDVNAISNILAIAPILKKVEKNLDELINGVSKDDKKVYKELLKATIDTVKQVRKIASAGVGSLVAPLNQEEFWEEMAESLVEDLIIQYLEARQPVFFGLLHFSGAITFDKKKPTGPYRVHYTKSNIHWARFFEFIADPPKIINELYHWDDPDSAFDHERFIRVLERIFLSFGVYATTNLPRKSLAEHLNTNAIIEHNIRELDIPIVDVVIASENAAFKSGIVLLPIPPPNGSQPTGFLLSPQINGGFSHDFYFSRDIFLRLAGGFDVDNNIIAKFYPDEVSIEHSLQDVEIASSIALVGDPEEPWILIGSKDSHRLELGGFLAELSMFGTISQPEFRLQLGTGDVAGSNPPKFQTIIQFEEGDGFLNKIVGTEPIILEFFGNLIWSSRDGFRFEGQAGLEVVLQLHLDLGPIQLKTLHLSIKGGNISSKPGLLTTIGLGVGAELGPVALTVENVGFSLGLVPVDKDDEPGALGGLYVDFGFKPPNGIGIDIDTESIKGGGYLYIEPEKGQYAGVAELSIQNLVSLKVFGIITTKNPDGTKGYSFIMMVFGEFTPIQLGMGFTLNGLGALVGINRGVSTNALVKGAIDGSIDNIMFPDDPVANAPRIIRDMNTFFPIAQKQYTFGFMGKLGWGAPTSLLTVELGLIFTFPEPVSIYILGVVKIILPDKKAPVVKLQINFIGEINFTEKYMFFLGTLFDSGILFFKIEGDMYFAIDWGDNPSFVFSIGGFHPDYIAPPLKGDVKELTRLRISLVDSSVVTVKLEFYMAITSNSVQFGASLDLKVDVKAFSVVGWLYFDALFQFDPFYMKVSISAGLAVKAGRSTLFEISFSGTLEGPTPWKISGYGSFKIFFIRIKVRVNKTIGDNKDTSVPPMPLLDIIQQELTLDQNWQTYLPPNSNLLVTVRKMEEDELKELIAHSNSIISFSQNKVPLDITLDKFGPNEISDYSKFSISLADTENSAEVRTYFAPAQFEEMSDEEKISRKSYEKMKSGVQGKNAMELVWGEEVEKPNVFETTIIDNKQEPVRLGSNEASKYQFFEERAYNRTSIARSRLGKEQKAKRYDRRRASYTPEILGERYVIINTKTQKQIDSKDGKAYYQTETEARQRLKALRKENPFLEETGRVTTMAELEEVEVV